MYANDLNSKYFWNSGVFKNFPACNMQCPAIFNVIRNYRVVLFIFSTFFYFSMFRYILMHCFGPSTTETSCYGHFSNNKKYFIVAIIMGS